MDGVLLLKLNDEPDEESLYRSKIDLVQLESLELDVVVLIELKNERLLMKNQSSNLPVVAGIKFRA